MSWFGWKPHVPLAPLGYGRFFFPFPICTLYIYWAWGGQLEQNTDLGVERESWEKYVWQI